MGFRAASTEDMVEYGQGVSTGKHDRGAQEKVGRDRQGLTLHSTVYVAAAAASTATTSLAGALGFRSRLPKPSLQVSQQLMVR